MQLHIHSKNEIDILCESCGMNNFKISLIKFDLIYWYLFIGVFFHRYKFPCGHCVFN